MKLLSLCSFPRTGQESGFPIIVLPCLQSRLVLKDAANAEANVVVAVRGIVVVPIRNGAVVGIVVEVTAAFHTVGTAC